MSVVRRTIASAADVPAGITPRREVTKRGYVELFWRVGRGRYLRCWEHRLVAGFPKGHVHHKNGVKSDNRPENLECLSASEHIREHEIPAHNRIDVDEALIRQLFQNGYGTPRIARYLGVSTMPVARTLKALGLRRQPGRIAGATHSGEIQK